jgi:hypothetical protein
MEATSVEPDLDADERLALQKLKDEYQHTNGCEFLQRELDTIDLGNRSGYSIKDGHVDTINLQVDRQPLSAHNRNEKFKDFLVVMSSK